MFVRTWCRCLLPPPQRGVGVHCHFFALPQRNGERKGTKGLAALWKPASVAAAIRRRLGNESAGYGAFFPTVSHVFYMRNANAEVAATRVGLSEPEQIGTICEVSGKADADVRGFKGCNPLTRFLGSFFAARQRMNIASDPIGGHPKDDSPIVRLRTLYKIGFISKGTRLFHERSFIYVYYHIPSVHL